MTAEADDFRSMKASYCFLEDASRRRTCGCIFGCFGYNSEKCVLKK